jgi:predicted phage terminase large subunit-like protein
MHDVTSDVEDRQLLRAVLRKDFPAFIERCFHTVSPGDGYRHNWHIEAIAHHLELCRRGKIRRLLITVPPRSLKSICSSIAFPAWLLGQDPTLQIMCLSYAKELSAKLSRDCRAVLKSDWYRWAFPNTVVSNEKDTESEIATTRRGVRLATSTDGAVTGRGADFIIVDDPMKPQDAMSKAERERITQLFDGTITTRLNDKNNGCIIVVMQRLHVDDLVGHLLPSGDWVHLCLPAISEDEMGIMIGDKKSHLRLIGDVLHPARESLEILMGLKRQLGSFFFAAQYQQNPFPEGGGLIKWNWFQSYKERPTIDRADQIIQSWDTASKPDQLNDYSVCTTWLLKGSWMEGDLYLLDVFRNRLLFPELKKKVEELHDRHKPRAVLIEDKGSGTGLIQVLRAERRVRPIEFKPEGDKITRMSNQCAKIEAGRVHVPERAPWLGEFKTELMGFPNARHDDQVDSVSQFLTWIDGRSTNFIQVGSFDGTVKYDSRYPNGRPPNR